MLFLFHAGNLGNLVLVKLFKRLLTGPTKFGFYLRTTLKIKNCLQLSLKIGTGTFQIVQCGFLIKNSRTVLIL